MEDNVMNADLLRFALSALLVSSLAGCSSVNLDDYVPDKKIDYRKEKAAAPGQNLEIPPDLTSSSISAGNGIPGVATSYSDYVANRQPNGQLPVAMQNQVLPPIQKVELRRDGEDRWLIIDGTPDAVWQKVVDYWQENGILLLEQDPTVGVMRTSWLENRATIKNDILTDTIRGWFDGIYDSGTRDQYRVRLERGEQPETTELYLTHFGMEEKMVTNASGETDRSTWVISGRDKELEAEMLRRIMVYLGVAEQRAETMLAAKKVQKRTATRLINTSTDVRLIVEEGFSRAWRLTGLSLDRVGFAVEDRDRSKGVYYVRYNDPAADVEKDDEGWLSKLAFWSSDEDKDVDKENRYLVVLRPANDGTNVVVFNQHSQRDNSPTALRILTLIHEQIR